MNLWDVKHPNPRSQVGDFSAVASLARKQAPFLGLAFIGLRLQNFGAF